MLLSLRTGDTDLLLLKWKAGMTGGGGGGGCGIADSLATMSALLMADGDGGETERSEALQLLLPLLLLLLILLPLISLLFDASKRLPLTTAVNISLLPLLLAIASIASMVG